MNKMLTAQKVSAGAQTTGSRRLLLSCLALLLLTLATARLLPVASAQTCYLQCQETYVGCLFNANGNASAADICDDNYDACLEACP